MDINITEGIDAYLVTKAKNNDRDYGHFHPSAWDGCHRKIAYLYYESKGLLHIDSNIHIVRPTLERIFDVGHYAHYRFRDYLQSYAPNCFMGRWRCLNTPAHPGGKIYGTKDKWGCKKVEVCECGLNAFKYEEVGYYDDKTWFGGHVDTVLDLKYWPLNKNSIEDLNDEDRYCLVDFKTMHPMMYKDLERPKPEHQTQMQIYLYLSGLKYGKFLYENKADQSIKEFLVVRDEQTIAVKVEEAIKLRYVLEHSNTTGKRVLPMRGHDSRGHTECLDCKFRGHCWKGIA
jgi:hypothetical protein